MNKLIKWFRNLGITTTAPKDDKETSDIFDYIEDGCFSKKSDEQLSKLKENGWELMDEKGDYPMIGKSRMAVVNYKFRRLKSLRPEKKYTIEELEAKEPQFKKGQKVYVIYHNVWKGFINIFQPPQAGIIVDKGDRKTHHFAAGYFSYDKIEADGKCRWYWIKFPCGTFEIPNTCIEDLEENIKKEKEWFELPYVKEMEKDPEQYSAGQKLKQQLQEQEKFLKV